MGAKFSLEASGQGAINIVRKLNQLLDESEKGFKKTAQGAGELERAAKRIVQQTEGPQERWNKKLAETQELFKKGKLTLDQAAQATAYYRQKLDEAGRAQERTFGASAVAQLKSYAAGFLGISGIIAGIRAEINALRAEGERTAQAKIGAADARRVLRSQIALATPEEQQLVLAAANRIPGELNVSSATTDLTLNSAVSASPDIARAVKFAEYGLRLTRGVGDTKAEIGGALDVGNALNSNDPQAAFAFLNAAKQVSRVEDTAAVAKNLPRVINAVAVAGADPRVGGALYAGLTVGGADPDSEISRTAAINLIDRANQFFTKNKFADIPLEQRDEFKEQIALLLNNDQLGQQFLKSDQFNFKAASRPAVQQLFTPGSTARAAYRKFFDVIGEDPSTTGQNLIDYVNAGRNEPAAEAERAIASVSEQRRLASGDTLSQARVDDIVAAIKAGRLSQEPSILNQSAWDWVIRSGLYVSAGPTLERGEAAGILNQEAQWLGRAAGRAAIYGDKDRAAAMEQQVVYLRQMADSLQNIDRKSNAATTQQE